MRFLKQLLYGTLYLAVLAGLALGFYQLFIRPAPSCTNNLLDRGEAGVDCGGVCQKICLPKDFKPLTASAVRVLPLGDAAERASFLVELRNPNPAHDASFSYALSVTDGRGASTTERGSGYIEGGEIKYLAFPNRGEFPGGAAAASFILAPNIKWQDTAIVRKANIGTNILNNAAEPGRLMIGGTVVNNDSVPLSAVELVAVFYDAFGNTLGVSGVTLEDIAPRQAREWSIIHPELAGMDAKRTQVFSYAYISD